MRILHLLSQTHLTGAEVYAADLCAQQVQQGHQCFIISDTLNVKAKAQYTPMDIHNRGIFTRIKHIKNLIQFCKKNQINLVHAHSRAGSWLMNIVVRFIPVAYVSSVHGRQGAHLSQKPKKNVYGKRIIAVCEHLQWHIKIELKIDEKIYLIRNIIND
jgi:hypothetical protein